MPKKFFTDTDIEELHRKGGKSLQVTDEVVLTDLAYAFLDPRIRTA